jgi:cell filamentation protein
MYEVEDDTYCYPGTTVLRNKLELKNQDELDAFEAEITAQRASEPLPSGDLSYERYCAIHRHFFQDVYSWAGKLRTVRISKSGSAFCYPENIAREMRRLFEELAGQHYYAGLDADAFARKAAHFLAELNAIHPFREGNGRTQLSFLTLLAEDARHPLDLEKLDPAKILEATIESFGASEKRLAAVIKDLIGP